jgi:hypothetical protein
VLRRLCLAAATLASLVACQPAAASSLGLVEIRGPNGALLAADRGGGPFSYPADGSLVKVRQSTVRNGAVILSGVSLFGGQVRATRIVVPARGHAGAKVAGLDIAGSRYRSTANTAISLGADSYMVALQEAVAPGLSSGRVGVVGLRVHLGTRLAGLPKGTELWVGIAAAAREPATGVEGVPAELIPIYAKAAKRYGVPWTVLAAINRFETGFGSNLNISSAGAVGWMQFLPSTWQRYGVDGNGDGLRNPYDPADAILSAARYLSAAGSALDLAGAVFSYNHSPSYVKAVLGTASAYANATPNPRAGGPLDPSLLGGR